jgi:hypothetical protein
MITTTASTQKFVETSVKSREKGRLRRFLIPLFLTVLVCSVIYYTWVHMVVPVYQGLEDQWHYGDHPIYTLDADVGGGTSHFLSMIWQGKIVVIEITPEYQSRIYVVGTLIVPDGAHPVIEMALADVNHDRRLDLLVHVQGQAASVVLLNTGNGFVVQGQ